MTVQDSARSFRSVFSTIVFLQTESQSDRYVREIGRNTCRAPQQKDDREACDVCFMFAPSPGNWIYLGFESPIDVAGDLRHPIPRSIVKVKISLREEKCLRLLRNQQVYLDKVGGF